MALEQDQDPGRGHVFMNARPASKYVNISLPQLYKLLEDGTIPAIKSGNRWRIPKAGLDRFVEQVVAGEIG